MHWASIQAWTWAVSPAANCFRSPLHPASPVAFAGVDRVGGAEDEGDEDAGEVVVGVVEVRVVGGSLTAKPPDRMR